MKLIATIPAGQLRPAITALSKVVNRHPNSPELGCIKVETVKRDTLRLTASDSNFIFAVNVPAENLEKREPCLVPLAGVQARVKGTKAGCPIEIVPSKLGVSKFPEMPKFRAAPIELDPSVSGSVLKAFQCASSDASRYVLQGAFIDVSDRKGHHVVGTDGRHLFGSNSFTLPGLKRSIILPAHRLWSSPLVRTSGPWMLRISSAGNPGTERFRIDTPSWSMSGKLVEGRFPNYRQVIPDDSLVKTKVTLDSGSLAALERIVKDLPGAKLPHSPVGLRLRKDRLQLIARVDSKEPYEVHGSIGVRAIGNDSMVFLNRVYLLKAMKFGLNQIEVIDEKSAVMLKRGGDVLVAMPVRADGEIKIRESADSAPPKTPTKRKRAKSTKARKPATATPKLEAGSAMDALSGRIADAKKALKSVDGELTSAQSELRKVRNEQQRKEKQVRGIRGALERLKNLRL